MKKIQIQFSLEKYLNGGYSVETRGDSDNPPKKVRILCTNRKPKSEELNETPIVALVGEDELVDLYDKTGNEGLKENRLVLVKQEFEDGDIISIGQNIGIFREMSINNDCLFTYVILLKNGSLDYDVTCDYHNGLDVRLATDEETDQLMLSMKIHGKIWNSKTKCIEKIVTPKFTLGEQVVVNDDYGEWKLDFYSHSRTDARINTYACVGGYWKYCLPLNDETKHLLGRKCRCPEKYKKLEKEDNGVSGAYKTE
jgi:hypothetical protein